MRPWLTAIFIALPGIFAAFVLAIKAFIWMVDWSTRPEDAQDFPEKVAAFWRWAEPMLTQQVLLLSILIVSSIGTTWVIFGPTIARGFRASSIGRGLGLHLDRPLAIVFRDIESADDQESDGYGLRTFLPLTKEGPGTYRIVRRGILLRVRNEADRTISEVRVTLRSIRSAEYPYSKRLRRATAPTTTPLTQVAAGTQMALPSSANLSASCS